MKPLIPTGDYRPTTTNETNAFLPFDIWEARQKTNKELHQQIDTMEKDRLGDTTIHIDLYMHKLLETPRSQVFDSSEQEGVLLVEDMDLQLPAGSYPRPLYHVSETDNRYQVQNEIPEDILKANSYPIYAVESVIARHEKPQRQFSKKLILEVIDTILQSKTNSVEPEFRYILDAILSINEFQRHTYSLYPELGYTPMSIQQIMSINQPMTIYGRNEQEITEAGEIISPNAKPSEIVLEPEEAKRHILMSYWRQFERAHDWISARQAYQS